MDALNTILQIPERSLVNKKITKAFFKRNFDLTITEKALLDDAAIFQSIEWLACISPSNSNINAYKDEHSIFEEVQIIAVHTSDVDFEKNQQRITDLVQKYIPYPILLCIISSQLIVINACDKKINQNDSAKRAVEKKYSSDAIQLHHPTEQHKGFLQSLAFDELDKTSLKTCYESYIRQIIALQAATVTGVFTVGTRESTQRRVELLEKIDSLQKEIQLLQNQAINESQLNKRVVLNTRLQEKRKEAAQLIALITA